MLTPRKKEEREKFISRCISFAIGEDMPQKQAVAACHSQWRRKEMSNKSKVVNDFIQELRLHTHKRKKGGRKNVESKK